MRTLRLFLTPLALAILAVGLAACDDTGEPVVGPAEDASSESVQPSASEETEIFEGIVFLEGRWEHVGDFPTAVSSLIFDAEGNATYFAEGDPDTFHGTVEATDTTAIYSLDMVAEDLDGNIVEGKEVHMDLAINADGSVLTATVDGMDLNFGREDT